MKITHCKIRKSTQKKLLEYFVLEVTARSAAEMLGIQASTAILFYRKIRQVICHHLMLEADALFEGSVELDHCYFGSKRKGKHGRGVRQEKWLFSAFSSVVARFIRSS